MRNIRSSKSRSVFSVCRVIRQVSGVTLASALLVASCSPSSSPTPIARLDWPPLASLLWAPAGDRIAVGGISGPNNASAIYVLQLNTGTMQLLVDQPYGNAVVQSWSPDGKSLAFAVTSSKNLKPGLWTIAAEGGAPPQFYGEGLGMAWSLNGDVVIYRKDFERQEVSLYLQRKDDKNPVLLFTRSGLAVRSLSWSPDGSKLLFLLARETEGNTVYVYDVEGGVANTVAGAGLIESPSWSPDGTMIAYVVGAATEGVPRYSLRIACADGSARIELPGPKEPAFSVWSPKAQQMAYFGVFDAGIYLLDLTRTLETQELRSQLNCAPT